MVYNQKEIIMYEILSIGMIIFMVVVISIQVVGILTEEDILAKIAKSIF